MGAFKKIDWLKIENKIKDELEKVKGNETDANFLLERLEEIDAILADETGRGSVFDPW